MKIQIERDSVSAGDDADTPLPHVLTTNQELSVEGCVNFARERVSLPRIHGGNATWVVWSGRPLAVIAQQWKFPRMLPNLPTQVDQLDWKEGTLTMRFNYLAQQDPEAVYEILQRAGRAK